jgi:hypothetical protein
MATVLIDRKRVDFTIAGGLTSGTDYAIGVNQVIYAVATVIGVYNAGGFGCRTAAVFSRGGGAAVLAAAPAGAANPMGNTADDAYGSDANFNSGAPTPSSAVWSASGNNAHLAITNTAAGQNSFVALLDFYVVT